MPNRIQRVALLIAGAAVLGSGALSSSAPAGQSDARYFYGKLQNRNVGDIRFAVANGVAQDIVVRARGKCLYRGEKVRPYYGQREATALRDAAVSSEGTFHERQRVDITLNRMELPYVRQITARIGDDGAEATGRIEWDTLLGGPRSKKVAHCDTGNRFAELEEVSRAEYVEIAADSPVQGKIP